MPKLGNGHHPRAGFVVTLVAALIGIQILAGPGSLAWAATANVVDDHDVQALTELVRPAGKMNAAVQTGQFEDLVRPTPVPTVAPTPVPTPLPTPSPIPKPALFEAGIASTYGE